MNRFGKFYSGLFSFSKSGKENPSKTTSNRLSLTQFPSAIYAVGDVHGCLNLYQKLESKIVKNGADITGPKLIVLLGDIVDRGPQTAQMIDYMLSSPPEGFQRIALMGNHEDMMCDFLRDPAQNMRWIDFGGYETLQSYGLTPDPKLGFNLPAKRLKHMAATCVPIEHVAYLENLPISLDAGDFFLSHAGYNPKNSLPEQSRDELIWGNPMRLDSTTAEKTAVHGHISVEQVEILSARIAVDTGAYATGILSAVRLMQNEDGPKVDILTASL